MRRAALLLGFFCTLAAAAMVPSAPGTPARPAVAPTFTLVSSPTCGSGSTRLGRGCVDRPAQTNWTIADGNVKWDMPGQWLTSYQWTVPGTVTAAGAALSLTLHAEERTGRPNNRICPAMGARSGFSFKGGLAQPVSLGFCAEAVVKPTADGSRTETLLPPSSAATGSSLTLTVGVQDGPTFTYTYKASNPGPKCRRPAGFASWPSARQDGCLKTVKFVFTQGGLPPGQPTRVLDIRTVGQGSGTAEFDEENRPIGHTFELKTARIVRERDYDDDGVERTQRLLFVLGSPADEEFGGRFPNPVGISTRLKLVSSSDPSCPAHVGSRYRKAQLLVLDGGSRGAKDIVQLNLEACRHQSLIFKGTKRVKVAITIK